MTCYAADNDASLWLLLHLIINGITIARDVMSESVGKDFLLFFSKFKTLSFGARILSQFSFFGIQKLARFLISVPLICVFLQS